MTSFSSAPSSRSSSQTSSNAVLQCANTRYNFADCGHVCLDRCTIHPIHPETLMNTCPNPRAGFASITVQGSCPKCASQAFLREMTDSFKQRLANLRQAEGADLGLGGVRSDAISLLTEAVRANEKKLSGSGGGAGLEVIGVGWSGKEGKEDFSYILWMTCEDDTTLWTWDC
ncbi:hypothetical protein Q7P37_005959 [Cladosporium fusiforme]